MPSLLETISAKAEAFADVDGVRWHYHSVTSHDTLKSGVAMLLALKWDPKTEKLDERSLLEIYGRMGPEGASQNQQAMEAIVCAGVYAVEDPAKPGSRQDCTIVAQEKLHAPRDGRLFVGRLSGETIQTLYPLVMGLSTDGGKALQRASAFRESSDGAPNGAPFVPIIRLQTG